EVADIVEQIFRIAATCDLNPRPEEYDAAACDYAAEHGLSVTGMCEQMRQYGTLSEAHERALLIALMRLYEGRRRPWRPEGRRATGPLRQPRKSRMVPRARRPRLEAGPRADWDIVMDTQSQTH